MRVLRRVSQSQSKKALVFDLWLWQRLWFVFALEQRVRTPRARSYVLATPGSASMPPPAPPAPHAGLPPCLQYFQDVPPCPRLACLRPCLHLVSSDFQYWFHLIWQRQPQYYRQPGSRLYYCSLRDPPASIYGSRDDSSEAYITK
jgi:hypothetical protein